MTVESVVLVGLMGAGKSTVGAALAERLGTTFVDTDTLVESAAGASIEEIFAREGEASFRARERAALAMALDGEAGVVATGGGAPTIAETAALLGHADAVLWLHAAPEVLAGRIDPTSRPLLDDVGALDDALARLAAQRAGAYRGVSHAIVLAHPDVDEVVSSMHAALDRIAASERIRVDVVPAYDVVVGPAAWDGLAVALAGRRRVAVVTQEALLETAARSTVDALAAVVDEVTVHTMRDGEPAKSLTTVGELASELVRGGVLRGDAIVAVGGGVVGDTAGFAAAVYHRGIDVLQVPTTLLAMVDAAIGGKTAVNLVQGKNLVGAFHQPLGVYADPGTLGTLPERDYRSGLGEVAKYALMGDAELAALVLADPRALLDRRPDVLVEAIARSVRIKAAVVASDPEERTGRRATLNYGHTLAHALETVGEYDLHHGEAVAIGLVFAGALAGALGRISTAEVDRHREIVSALGLPTEVNGACRADELVKVMQRDKKASGALSFVLAGPEGLELCEDPDPSAVQSALETIGAS